MRITRLYTGKRQITNHAVRLMIIDWQIGIAGVKQTMVASYLASCEPGEILLNSPYGLAQR
jgi:hypothetical protein